MKMEDILLVTSNGQNGPPEYCGDLIGVINIQMTDCYRI